MVKNKTSQGTAEWPTSAQRVRKRRDSKVAYYNNNSKYSHRNIPGSSTPTLSAGSRPNVQIHQQLPAGQSPQLEFLDFYDLQTSATGSSFAALVRQDDRAEVSWLDTSMNSYTLPTRPPKSPQSVPNGSNPPKNAHAAQAYGSEVQSSWEGLTSPDNLAPDLDLLSPSDISRYGSFESFDSMTFLMSNTTASSVSESYACIGTGSGFESPGAQLHDLSLPGTSTM